ncbi:hypothetical protein ACWGM0_14040 [Sphingomonas bisphenolicum]
MFIRRQDLIDRFAANFRENASGECLFQPKKSKVGLPVTWEEYQELMSAFEKIQMQNMVVTWFAFIVAAIHGYHALIFNGLYTPFFVAIGIATLFSFAVTLRDGLRLLLPFIERRDLLEQMLIEQAITVAGNDQR